MCMQTRLLFPNAVLLGALLGTTGIVCGATPDDADAKKPVQVESLPKCYEMTIKREGKVETAEFVPGFFDKSSRTFYALQGVLFKAAPDPLNPYRRTPTLTRGEDKYNRVEYPLPVAYLAVAENKYAPGFNVEHWGTFYRWKGVTITSEELPEKDPKKPYVLLPQNPQWYKFYEIDPAKHFMDKPELWKKTTKTEKK